MKLFLNTILNLLLVSSYAQTFEWANTIGTNLPAESVASICNDDQGNVYVTGTVTATYYSFSSNNHYAHFGNDSLPIHGANDIYIAKYDPNGVLVWEKTLGGDYDWNPSNTNATHLYETVTSISFNSKINKISITGTVLGNCSINNQQLLAASNSERNVFIAAFSESGVCDWIRKIGSSNNSDRSICVKSYLDGFLYSGGTKGISTYDTFQIQPGGYLTFYNQNGSCKWVKNFFDATQNMNIGSVKELAIIGKMIFALGAYNNIDSIFLDSTLLPVESNRFGSVFFCLDSSGVIQWYKNFTSPSNSIWQSTMNSDNVNSLLLNLPFSNYLVVDNTDTIFATDSIENVIAKFQASGINTIIKPLGSLTPNELLLLPNQKIISLGNISSSRKQCNNTINPIGQNEIFISILDSTADCDTTFLFGKGGLNSTCYSLDGNILVAGSIGKESNSVNELVLGELHLFSKGFTDGFIAKFNGLTSGIDDRSRKSKNINESLLIYANPSNGKCDIDIPDEFLHEKELKLSIYSSTGVLIQQAIVNMNEETIKVDIQQEAKGMYNATLSNGKKVYQGRIVFE
jgi:hypothetical protein